MASQVWFGTADRMEWAPAPSASGVDRSVQPWYTNQQFLNGGQWTRRSATGARRQQLTWPIMRASEVQKIAAFTEGVYGPGPFYYSDPFAWRNVLPTWIAAPWLATDDAPRFAKTAPKPTVVATPANTNGHPLSGALYTGVNGTLTGYRFPVPPGTTAYFGWKGAVTGSATVRVNGVTVAPTAVTSTTLTNYTVVGGSTGTWVILSFQGAGNITMYSAHLSLGSSAPTGSFVKGEGFAGLSVDGEVQITGYSAVTGQLDRQAISANFVETEPWQ